MAMSSRLVHLHVLGLGLLQDGDVTVCVFPEREEIIVRTLCLHAISRQRAGSSSLQMRQCADWVKPDNAAMIEDLLKFSRRFRVATRGHESHAPHIGRVQTTKI